MGLAKIILKTPKMGSFVIPTLEGTGAKAGI
jgi:hypothetical protein